MKKVVLIALLGLCAISISAQIPKAILKDINGKPVSTDTLSNNGKPFVIDFFAT